MRHSVLVTILVVGAVAFSFSPALGAGEEEGKLGIGASFCLAKFVGGEIDRSVIGPAGDFDLTVRLNKNLRLGLYGGYGQSRDKEDTRYATWFTPFGVRAIVDLTPEKRFIPQILLNVGAMSWHMDDDGDKLQQEIDGKLEDVEGFDPALGLGLAFSYFLKHNIALTGFASYTHVFKSKKDMWMGGYKDANEALVQGGIGFRFMFTLGPCKDSDGDGVNDNRDKCPDTPMGAYIDEFGCPIDSDGDGVPDGLDQCEGTPQGAIVDARGCPKDSDSDRVYDGIDRCPGTLRGAVVDAYGCPRDSDGDGVYDGIDRCPNTPREFEVDRYGCPLEKPLFEEEKPALILEGVSFQTGKAILTPESEGVLDKVARALRAYPDVNVEIAGYTDSVGSDAINMNLSDLRACAVRDYLISKGVARTRLTAKGYGEANPIATNDTPEGRAKNRRVEVKRIK